MARVAIYNAFLATLGGGELCTLAAAAALARDGHDVEILALPGTMLEPAYGRFGLPAPPAGVRLVRLDPGRHEQEAEERSADHDVFLSMSHLSGVPNRAPRGLMWPWFPARPESRGIDLTALGSYDGVLATSRYVADWIRRWWDVRATVVHPPVMPLSPAAERERSIVVLGRFQGGGHSKCQLALVRAFGGAVAAGLLEGWTLDLVGGVAAPDRPYLDAVRAASEGLPVRLWVDASRETVAERVSRAAIAWQATGWGADPETEPERFEHFGIALVEAMSAGAVPVALGVGGPREIVTDGVDGVLWDQETGPIPATAALAGDPARLAALSAAAREGATRFGLPRFEAAFENVLNGALSDGDPD